jgi:hypothetical protein
MDFWRTVGVLFRRWYITVPAFCASLALAAAAYSVVPVTYQSGSILVLTTPLAGGTETTRTDVPGTLTNPLLNFDRSLSLTAAIVIQQMNSLETASELGVSIGSPVSYQVTNGSTNPELLESGPFLFVQGSGPSAAAAQDITQKAAAIAVDILAQRQVQLNAPPSTHISVQQVVPATIGEPLDGSAMRAAAAAGALACLGSLAAVYGFESLMTHRRRRRFARLVAADGPEVPPSTAPTSPRLVTEGSRVGNGEEPDGGRVRAATPSALGVLERHAPPDGGERQTNPPNGSMRPWIRRRR